MAWLVLLLLVALVTVVVVTRNLLVAEAESDATDALNQEAEEFKQFAAAGVDQETGARYENGTELLERHISRQFLDDDEIVLGITAEGAIVPQRGREAIALAERASRWQQIVANPASTDILPTRDGRLRWVKVPVVDDVGNADGTFVVAYAIDREIREIDETIRTLVLVSAIGLVVAAIASWVVSGQILEPVNLVRRAAARISHDDLTERIAVEGRDDIAALSEQFNGMLDRLEHAFGAQRQFLDDASHELRTPITIIRGNLEFVGDDDPAERAEVVRLCTDELDRMGRIVEDLLLLAKAERPDFVVAGEVGLVDLTSDIYAKLGALGDRRWELESIAEGEGLLDGQRVTQAVIQLAHNAVGHTRAGDVIRFGSAVTAAEASFWVADTGDGVRPEDAEAIFQRFSRGSAGGARANHTGAGLGLTIVTAIAEGHGGHVELQTTYRHGARFSLHLPQPAGHHERIEHREDDTA
ncbi:sensor histidine kinase [Pseudonocardia abyssalis]|uniref:histidine kinase n=1 Tax=Pseudonocardia abyssalis TaxID=2792008 RepID=A0ABS6ULQ1_9PSEU|nr:HAMP domain-containing sensor histidine kinase [Pseudonocardia abyssalis]MBW0117895.1 HAMP domain-containing histidine kinase [Pseudonocardia abyssalis]MBW0133156.1 HAMP domain-containing histidine kinase [Pseudonocardia abyssalis]